VVFCQLQPSQPLELNVGFAYFHSDQKWLAKPVIFFLTSKGLLSPELILNSLPYFGDKIYLLGGIVRYTNLQIVLGHLKSVRNSHSRQ
jgi:hypothetical protein